MESEFVQFTGAASRLRARREELGLAPADVAKSIGVDPARYRAWEQHLGARVAVRYASLLAHVLGVNSDWLLNGERARSDPAQEPPNPVAEALAARALLARLGGRARARRMDLGWTTTDIAISIGVTASTLSLWETGLPEQVRFDAEALWEQALEVPAGWLRDTRLATPGRSRSGPRRHVDVSASAAGSVAQEIVVLGVWVSRAPNASRTFSADDLNATEKRRATIFAERFGAHGPAKVSIEAICKTHKISPKTAREMVLSLCLVAKQFDFNLPLLDALRTSMAGQVPQPIEQIEARYRSLLGIELSIRDAHRFAVEITGRGVL